MNEKRNYDVVILYSGGADSRLMLEFAKMSNKIPYCLMIDYFQLHNEELEFAKKQLEKQKIDYKIVSISGLNFNSGLTGSGEKGRWKNVNEWHVPGRNTIFLGIALGVAEDIGATEIWNGADWSDRLNQFPDCYQEYIVAANNLTQLAGPYPIKYLAPLQGMSKEMILSMLKNLGINKNEIFTGYGNLEKGE